MDAGDGGGGDGDVVVAVVVATTLAHGHSLVHGHKTGLSLCVPSVPRALGLRYDCIWLTLGLPGPDLAGRFTACGGNCIRFCCSDGSNNDVLTFASPWWARKQPKRPVGGTLAQ